MTFYDDELDCPRCSRHLSAEDLCEHDDPMCPRCCAVDKHADDEFREWMKGAWAS